MNKLVLENKLESLRRCIERVSDKTPATVDELVSDFDAQDVIVLNLSRAVQLAVDIGSHIVSEKHLPAPSTMKKVFDSLQSAGVLSEAVSLRMKNAVGFRNIAVHCYDDLNLNIAVHCYDDLNLNIVFAICTQRLDDFKQFAKEVYGFLNADE